MCGEPAQEAITKADPAAIEEIVSRYGRSSDFIIPMLQDVQHTYGYLPREAAREIARSLGVPLSQIYAVATFYRSFSLKPRGKHLITICTGTVCSLKGANRIVEAIQGLLGVEPGGTSEDRVFTLQSVNCLGACALAPVMMIDERYYGKVKVNHIPSLLAEYRKTEGSA
jgi:NADH-quinone oxidoreductase subunit E